MFNYPISNEYHKTNVIIYTQKSRISNLWFLTYCTICSNSSHLYSPNINLIDFIKSLLKYANILCLTKDSFLGFTLVYKNPLLRPLLLIHSY